MWLILQWILHWFLWKSQNKGTETICYHCYYCGVSLQQTNISIYPVQYFSAYGYSKFACMNPWMLFYIQFTPESCDWKQNNRNVDRKFRQFVSHSEPNLFFYIAASDLEHLCNVGSWHWTDADRCWWFVVVTVGWPKHSVTMLAAGSTADFLL